MSKVHIWPVNLSVTITKLDAFQFQFPGSARAVVKAIADQILEDSDRIPPTVPIDTNRLRSTGRVEQVRGGYAVMYGGLAEDGFFVNYANQVHDDLRPRQYKRPGAGPKFVEAHYLTRTMSAGPEFERVFLDLSKRIFK
jgi:hypothetical protein